MRLTMSSFHVEEIVFGAETLFRDGILHVNLDEFARHVIAGDENIAGVEVSAVHPGERARILHCLDSLEPRIKTEGPGQVFPGFAGPPVTVGSGETNRLKGMAIITSSRYPEPTDGLLVPREGVIDMFGVGAEYGLLSNTLNLVLVYKPAPAATNEEYDASMRAANIRAAIYLARTTLGQHPDSQEVFELLPPVPGLPNVVYINQVQSQGLFAQTFAYGRNLNDLLPTVIHPNELLDGALVSGNFVYGSVKNPTYLHCNNPIVLELYRRQGKQLNFRGVVISKGHNYTSMLKQRSASYAAKIARFLDAEGVIVTQEGGGNAGVDAMLTVEACERMGMKTVFLSVEQGGRDGSDTPLVFSVPDAVAIVSVGAQEREVELPPADLVIGGESLLEHVDDPRGAIRLLVEELYGATSQLGNLRLTCRTF